MNIFTASDDTSCVHFYMVLHNNTDETFFKITPEYQSWSTCDPVRSVCWLHILCIDAVKQIISSRLHQPWSYLGKRCITVITYNVIEMQSLWRSRLTRCRNRRKVQFSEGDCIFWKYRAIFAFCWQIFDAWHPCHAPAPRQSLLSLLLLRIIMSIEKQFCQKCNYAWYPIRETKPKVCPRCKSYNWEKNLERKKWTNQ